MSTPVRWAEVAIERLRTRCGPARARRPGARRRTPAASCWASIDFPEHWPGWGRRPWRRPQAGPLRARLQPGAL